MTARAAPHDYEYLARGKVVPHGIYDLLRNQGYISIGTNAETAEFVVDNLLWWWETYGLHQYADCQRILILCDAGGANSYRHHCFKKQLLWLSAQIGRELLICHYPPYCSKWNPIEHRLFSQVHRAMAGVILWDHETVRNLISQTSTQTGLSVVVRIVEKQYEKGLKTARSEIDLTRIRPHPINPQLTGQSL